MAPGDFAIANASLPKCIRRSRVVSVLKSNGMSSVAVSEMTLTVAHDTPRS